MTECVLDEPTACFQEYSFRTPACDCCLFEATCAQQICCTNNVLQCLSLPSLVPLQLHSLKKRDTRNINELVQYGQLLSFLQLFQ